MPPTLRPPSGQLSTRYALVLGLGEVYLELYLSAQKQTTQTALYRSGTRVMESLADLEAFQNPVWSEGALEGIVDAPFLNLTPGTRTGIVRDEAFSEFCAAMEPVTERLSGILEEQRKAEEERASRQVLRTIQNAFREAMLSLPPEEWSWFQVHGRGAERRAHSNPDVDGVVVSVPEPDENQGATPDKPQKAFFEYAGPLFSVRISPSSSVLPVGQSRTFRAVARDRVRHLVENGLEFHWDISEGGGSLDNESGEIATFTASSEPGLARLRVTVIQNSISCQAEGIVTVTDSLLREQPKPSTSKDGLPGYTFRRAPGELWRSKYDGEQNVIVINSGHRDFVFASRTRTLKLRYIARLYGKELICKNFPGHSSAELLERMIELQLYTEENLK